MKTIITLLFLVFAISALQAESTHHQAKSAAANSTPAAQPKPQPTAPPAVKPAQPTQPTQPAKPVQPVQPAQPAKPKHQPHKEPGYPAVAGNPFGRDPQGHRTCFQVPCYDPTDACTVTVKAAPPAKAAAGAKTSHPVATKPGAKPANTKTSTAVKFNSPPATTTRAGTWTPVLYVVRINGRIARYAGYRCK